MERLLSEFEAARFLAMRTAEVRRLARTGILPSISFPDCPGFRFDRGDLADWASRYKHKADPQPTPMHV